MTALGDFTAGDVLTAADMNAIGTWAAFTPVWTASGTNPTIGNGTLRGRYTQINKLVIAQYDLRMGSTTTFGSGTWNLTFPVSASFTGMWAYMDLGTGRLYDASVQTVYNLHVVGEAGNANKFRLGVDGAPSTNVSSTVPFTWATGDEVLFTIWYEAT